MDEDDFIIGPDARPHPRWIEMADGRSYEVVAVRPNGRRLVNPTCMTAEEHEAILDGPTPIGDAARNALLEFASDRQRVRTVGVHGKWVAFVITSKPSSGAPTDTPLFHAGVEPASTMQLLDDSVLAQEDGVVVTARLVDAHHEHRCWPVLVERGRLVRVWQRGRDGGPNSAEWFFAIKPDGAVRSVNAIIYQRLRAALRRASSNAQ